MSFDVRFPLASAKVAPSIRNAMQKKRDSLASVWCRNCISFPNASYLAVVNGNQCRGHEELELLAITVLVRLNVNSPAGP